jgi:hypothetical protein
MAGGQPGQSQHETLSKKQVKIKRMGCVVQVVQCLGP